MSFLLVLAVAAALQTWGPHPAGGMTLKQVDGGSDYYAKFSHGLPSRRSFFPIGVWFESVLSQRDVDLDKKAGLNTYVVLTGNSDLNLIHSNGMHALLQGDNSDWLPPPAKPFAGWLLGDEVDMTLGPGAGHDQMQRVADSLPSDDRIRLANYGKGVLFWEDDPDAARFVNQYQQIVSTDLYWFTDPWQSSMQAPDWLPEGAGGDGPTISGATVRRAANYGYQVDRVRALAAMDGKPQPVWTVIEVGWPFTQTAAEGGRQIQPAEIRAAVWQSIIAGARGIIYFNHSFGGPGQSQHVLRDAVSPGSPYAANRAMVSAVDAQITALAPVLNSPSVASGWSHGPGTTAMVKWVQGKKGAKKKKCRSKAKKRTCKKAKGHTASKKHCRSRPTTKRKCRKGPGHLYVFAGSAGMAVDGRFSLPCTGNTKATVIGENRAVPVRKGSFRDHFANGNAIHIYRIDAASRCGRSRGA